MKRYAIRRFLLIIPTVLIVSITLFILIKLPSMASSRFAFAIASSYPGRLPKTMLEITMSNDASYRKLRFSMFPYFYSMCGWSFVLSLAISSILC